MFTGLIEDVGTLIQRSETGKDGKLSIKTRLPVREIAIGDSIAVNGACLTVEEKQSDGLLNFHTLSETLKRTNLGVIPIGSAVNLERAMQLGARLGGHLVQGHVDATAEVLAITQSAADIAVSISLPESLAHLVIAKGSIAINGISLTIAHLADNQFTVHIIPHTWEMTNLRDAQAGAPVNLEADMIGKYVLRQKDVKVPAPPNVTMDDLRDAGW